MSSTTLLPCPFCGLPAEMEPWHGGAPIKQRIGCSNAQCEVSPSVTGETPDEAAEHWNRRAPGSASDQLKMYQLGVQAFDGSIRRLTRRHLIGLALMFLGTVVGGAAIGAYAKLLVVALGQ